MGFFSGISRTIKKITRPITKVVKSVVKGIKKIGSSIAKSVKKVVKKVGKTVSKLGPLASIAIGFIPGFQALWANAGIWGAIGKGALTGFITSGGKLKGALIGAAGGAIGYGANAGIDAYNKGFNSLGDTASMTDKIAAGFKSVGTSVSDGFSNMYKSASDIVSTGDLSRVNYLDDTGQSIYKTHDVGTEVYDKAGMLSQEAQQAEIDQYAKKLGLTDTGPDSQARMLWEQTGGADVEMSFDWAKTGSGGYRYTGEGLDWTMGSAGLSSELPKPKSGGVADAIGNLLKGDEEAAKSPLAFGQDVGSNVALKGVSGVGGSAGMGTEFAQSYGGVMSPTQYSELMKQSLLQKLA